MSSHNHRIIPESTSTLIPMTNVIRSTSPYQRRQSESNATSGTDDDDDWGDSIREPFLTSTPESYHPWKGWLHNGNCGKFFFNTPLGWHLYVGILVLWLGGCQIGLILMNRIILWSGYLHENYTHHTKLMVLIAGVYKFPYPLTTTLIEMILTHFWLLLSAYITRWISPWLLNAGLSGGIAPSAPLKTPSSGFRGGPKSLGTRLRYHEGGIAGGGFFEFDIEVVKVVLPCALIFVAKVCLSNLSFAYAQLQIYFLARIATVPFMLLFAHILMQTSFSVATISSSLTATLTLLVATSRGNMRVTWESIVAGIFSSIFVALYPIILLRTYKILASQLLPQGPLGIVNATTNSPSNFSGTKEEARAYWRLLHYISTISILTFTPVVLLSGEVSNIWRNCYFLDVFFHWLMVICGGLGSWAVFWATVALTRATSPLTVVFLSIPRAAFLLPIISGWKMPVYSWIGIGMCWASCAWFWMARKREGKSQDRLH
ncbi:Bgt-3057 [Blumeria graminis f. sp. tritici]|uniref:GDP-mannose transporter n=2 Tax=Blumeria graminis f. sp. tritici TaxID=62690 RepID=A0A061HNY8_BLUGR|nr:hypothetical protein BGT96224_3057 [Blumeria graminis f. sp. tritici 96224]VDB87886.1 Bgt-3057 [Blumeria graminis f. sp. tritici]